MSDATPAPLSPEELSERLRVIIEATPIPAPELDGPRLHDFIMGVSATRDALWVEIAAHAAALGRELEAARAERDRVRAASVWLSSHAPRTPVPDWVDKAVNSPPAPPSSSDKGEAETRGLRDIVSLIANVQPDYSLDSAQLAVFVRAKQKIADAVSASPSPAPATPASTPPVEAAATPGDTEATDDVRDLQDAMGGLLIMAALYEHVEKRSLINIIYALIGDTSRSGGWKVSRTKKRLIAPAAATPGPATERAGEWVSVTPETMPKKRNRVIAAKGDYIVGDCFYGAAGQPLLAYDAANNVERWRYSTNEKPVEDFNLPDQWMPFPAAPASPSPAPGPSRSNP